MLSNFSSELTYHTNIRVTSKLKFTSFLFGVGSADANMDGYSTGHSVGEAVLSILMVV